MNKEPLRGPEGFEGEPIGPRVPLKLPSASPPLQGSPLRHGAADATALWAAVQ